MTPTTVLELDEVALELAAREVGVRETGGNNRGPRVREYLAALGRPEGEPWCASFVSWVVHVAAEDLGITPQFRLSPSALHLWQLNQHLRAPAPTAGTVFVIDHGHGLGHCGFVVAVDGDELRTIEGNTTVAGQRDSLHGDGVFARSRRASEVNVGYLRIA